MRGLCRILEAAGEAVCKSDIITRWFAASERLEDDVVAALRLGCAVPGPVEGYEDAGADAGEGMPLKTSIVGAQ